MSIRPRDAYEASQTFSLRNVVSQHAAPSRAPTSVPTPSSASAPAPSLLARASAGTAVAVNKPQTRLHFKLDALKEAHSASRNAAAAKQVENSAEPAILTAIRRSTLQPTTVPKTGFEMPSIGAGLTPNRQDLGVKPVGATAVATPAAAAADAAAALPPQRQWLRPKINVTT